MDTIHPFNNKRSWIDRSKSGFVGVLTLVGVFSFGMTALVLYSIFVMMSIEFLDQNGIIAEFQAAGIVWLLRYWFSYPFYLMFAATVASVVQNARSVLGADLDRFFTRSVCRVVLGAAAIGAMIPVVIQP